MKHILTSMEHTADFLRSTYALNPKCSDELLKTDDYYKAEDIVNVDKLIHEIIQSEEVLFYTHAFISYDGQTRTIVIGCEKPFILEWILRYIDSAVFKSVETSFPVHHFNPYFFLLIHNIRKKLGFDNGKQFSYKAVCQNNNEANRLSSQKKIKFNVDILNAFIENIRLEAKSQEFEKNIKEYQRRSNDNYKSLLEYINELFDKYAVLMVLRVDFGYKEKDLFMYEKPRKEMIEEKNAKCLQALKDRNSLFNNIRKNKISKHMAGYAWKLEYGFEKGIHYHMFFFFDGSQVLEDEDKARSIGEYWKTTVTNGRGIYHNCNADKGSYKYLGIGIINSNDFKSRKDLEKASLYLTKNDYCKVELIIDQKKSKYLVKRIKCWRRLKTDHLEKEY